MEAITAQKLLPGGPAPYAQLEMFTDSSWNTENIAGHIQVPEAHLCLVAIGNRGLSMVTRGADGMLWRESPLRWQLDEHISERELRRLIDRESFVALGDNGHEFSSPDELHDFRWEVTQLKRADHIQLGEHLFGPHVIEEIFNAARQHKLLGNYDSAQSAYGRLLTVPGVIENASYMDQAVQNFESNRQEYLKQRQAGIPFRRQVSWVVKIVHI